MEYGYLESRSNEDVVRGIRQLQGFAGLELTGKMDQETVQLVKTPRCGMPDFEPSHNMKRRKRRYALHYSVWKKHVSDCIAVVRLGLPSALTRSEYIHQKRIDLKTLLKVNTNENAYF
jgi:hypothetical protein